MVILVIIHNPTIVNIDTIKRSRDAFIYLDKFSRLMINRKMIALIMVLSFVMFGAAVSSDADDRWSDKGTRQETRQGIGTDASDESGNISGLLTAVP